MSPRNIIFLAPLVIFFCYFCVLLFCLCCEIIEGKRKLKALKAYVDKEKDEKK